MTEFASTERRSWHTTMGYGISFETTWTHENLTQKLIPLQRDPLDPTGPVVPSDAHA